MCRGTMHRAQRNENNIKAERAQFIVPLQEEKIIDGNKW